MLNLAQLNLISVKKNDFNWDFLKNHKTIPRLTVMRLKNKLAKFMKNFTLAKLS